VKSRAIYGILQTSLFKIFYHVQSRILEYDNKNIQNFRWQEERAVDRMSAFLHHRRSLLPCKSLWLSRMRFCDSSLSVSHRLSTMVVIITSVPQQRSPIRSSSVLSPVGHFSFYSSFFYFLFFSIFRFQIPLENFVVKFIPR
jgi:hypothetical protein